MPPEPLPYPDPSEASKRSSLLPTSLLSLLKKADIVMNTVWPNGLWSLCLVPAKKNSRVKLEEELEMREGIGLMRGVASPCQEFGGGTGTRVVPPDHPGSVSGNWTCRTYVFL